MKEFVLFFRMDIQTPDLQPSAEQMQEYLKKWDRWIREIANQNRLAEGGNHLSSEGKIIKPNNVVLDEPYTKDKESIAGYIIIKAKDFDGAIDLAKDCPILYSHGTSVEVREAMLPR